MNALSRREEETLLKTTKAYALKQCDPVLRGSDAWLSCYQIHLIPISRICGLCFRKNRLRRLGLQGSTESCPRLHDSIVGVMVTTWYDGSWACNQHRPWANGTRSTGVFTPSQHSAASVTPFKNWCIVERVIYVNYSIFRVQVDTFWLQELLPLVLGHMYKLQCFPLTVSHWIFAPMRDDMNLEAKVTHYKWDWEVKIKIYPTIPRNPSFTSTNPAPDAGIHISRRSRIIWRRLDLRALKLIRYKDVRISEKKSLRCQGTQLRFSGGFFSKILLTPHLRILECLWFLC